MFGGVVGLGLERMTPTLYRATATILIQPPQFSSELTPKALSIGAYSALLNADYTTSQVRKILVDEGVLPPGVNLRWLKSRVTTTIPSSGAGRQQMSLPLIEITASAGKPEMAATIANTYASVFARMSREIASRGQEGALQLIESQYPTSLKRLTVAAEEFKNRHDGYARRKEELNQKWNMRLSDFQAETVRLVAQFEKGTHQLTLEFAETHNPSLLEGQLARRQKRLIALEGDLEKTRFELRSTTYALLERQKLIEQEPELITLAQAFPEGPWWNQIDANDALVLARELKDIAISSEEPNPIHAEIRSQLIQTQVKVETLKPKAEDLGPEIQTVAEQVEALRRQIGEIRREEFDLRQTRRLESGALRKKRAERLAGLQSQRTLETDAFARNRDLYLAPVSREKNAAQASFNLIEGKYESARLAKSEQEADVKIGALALPPESPAPRRTMFKTAIGLVAGFLLTLFAVAIFEAFAMPGVAGRYEAKEKSPLKGHSPRRLVRG